MNTIKLCGGLGNQLFQYAFGRVQKENGIEVEYDVSWFNGKNAQKPLRTYALDKFTIDVPFIKERIYRKTIIESGFNPSLLQKDGFNFHGYWQYPDYYTNVLPILKSEIHVRQEYYTKEFLRLRTEILLKENTVSIHVRRGDYLQLPDFPVLPLGYYQEALKRVEGDVYIFSDDMDWCSHNFKGVQFVHLNEYLDFELMKLCKHNILSRSSFGWWAAYLNSNPNQIVVVPKQQIKCRVRKEAEKKNGVEVFDPKEWITL